MLKMIVNQLCVKYVILKVEFLILTVDIRESNTLTAKAVPQANGCVR